MLISIIIYLAVGAIVCLAHPWIRSHFADVARHPTSGKESFIKPVATLGVFLVACCVWPLALLNARKPKSVLDAINENPAFKQMKEIRDIMNLMSAGGCDTDEIPGAVGEFGLTPTNPIPTNTVFGSNSYLGRLETAEGEPVLHERLGSTTVDGFENPVDAYRITDSGGSELATIYISPYHKKTSEKAPRGFNLMFV